MSEDNPYYGFCGLFGGKASGGFKIAEGTVETVSPLVFSIWGNLFPGEELRINAQLLAGWKQTVSIQSSEPVAGEQTVTKGTLAAGDRVLCLTADDQTIYVLCKVVSG